MSDTVTSQLISHNFPGLTVVTPQQTPKEPLGSRPIAFGLEKYINYVAILIHSPPQVVLLAVYLYEYFIDIEDIAVAPMLSLQTSCV